MDDRGMQALTPEELAERERRAAPGMMQRGPLTEAEVAGMQNAARGWINVRDYGAAPQPRPPLRERLRRWVVRWLAG